MMRLSSFLIELTLLDISNGQTKCRLNFKSLSELLMYIYRYIIDGRDIRKLDDHC